jgi:hypothetical protein
MSDEEAINQLAKSCEGVRFKTLLWGNFSREQVSYIGPFDEFDAKYSADYAKQIQERIDAARARASAGRQMFRNDSIFRLSRAYTTSSNDGEMQACLELGLTSYFDYAGTRGNVNEVTKNDFADPIGSVIILVTSDGLLPFGRRAKKVEVNPGRIFSFGGFFDPSMDKDARGLPDLFSCFRRELHEELGLNFDKVEINFLGLIYDMVHPHPEAFALAIPSDMTAAIVKSSNWREELDDIELVERFM